MYKRKPSRKNLRWALHAVVAFIQSMKGCNSLSSERNVLLIAAFILAFMDCGIICWEACPESVCQNTDRVGNVFFDPSAILRLSDLVWQIGFWNSSSLTTARRLASRAIRAEVPEHKHLVEVRLSQTERVLSGFSCSCLVVSFLSYWGFLCFVLGFCPEACGIQCYRFVFSLAWGLALSFSDSCIRQLGLGCWWWQRDEWDARQVWW